MSTLHEAARVNLRKHYAMGMRDGIEETLDQLEGRSRLVPDGCYRGPMPDELLTWLADVRRRVDALGDSP